MSMIAGVQVTRAQAERVEWAYQAGDRCQVLGPPGPHGVDISRQNHPAVGCGWRCLQVQGMHVCIERQRIMVISVALQVLQVATTVSDSWLNIHPCIHMYTQMRILLDSR